MHTEREKLEVPASRGLILSAADVIGFLVGGKVILTPGSDK